MSTGDLIEKSGNFNYESFVPCNTVDVDQTEIETIKLYWIKLLIFFEYFKLFLGISINRIPYLIPSISTCDYVPIMEGTTRT